MATYTVYALGADHITISGGGELSGYTQGTGEHLDGLTITLDSPAWEAIDIDDSEANFQDSDNSQTLDGDQSFDGNNYTSGSRVEAEYRLILEDEFGNTYTVVGFNINEGGGVSYGTIEGLAFIGGPDGFPPIGVELTVIGYQEGPSHAYADLAYPDCLTPGVMIRVPGGEVPVETLKAGDLVETVDHGAQPLRWVGRAELPHVALEREVTFRPILIRENAFGPGKPAREMQVSPQHRIVIDDWRAELLFGAPEILVPAVKLINDISILRCNMAAPVSYLHLAFERHEVIWANGLKTESVLPKPIGLASDGHTELNALFPDLNLPGHHRQAARPCIADRRTFVLVGRPAWQ